MGLKTFHIIVASTLDGGIGIKGRIPWKLLADMEFFKTTTLAAKKAGSTNAVIMGRKTFESIPSRFRPLSGRLNVVLTRNPDLDFGENVKKERSLESALEYLSAQDHVDRIFIAGGTEIYAEALKSPQCESVYLTMVQGQFEVDTYMPAIPENFVQASKSERQKEGDIEYEFLVFVNKFRPHTRRGILPRVVHEEQQYLDLVRDIIYNGVKRQDRTGTGTVSKFGAQMRFNLRNNTMPLLTTKRVFWRGVVEELIWFMQGHTNANVLRDKDVHIWDGNATREYLDSVGLAHREQGDLGPVYGFQWRHYGAEYIDMHTDYTGKGIDQLQWVIDTIRKNPENRRIILTAWDPTAIPLMALPPCHVMAQFYVDTAKGELSCQMYQRSADMGLGVPFNIASYALLTHIIAKITGLKPGDFIHSIGDAHVYLNHIDPLLEQIQREPTPFPTLTIRPEAVDISSLCAEDFDLAGYNPHGKLAMQMAV